MRTVIPVHHEGPSGSSLRLDQRDSLLVGFSGERRTSAVLLDRDFGQVQNAAAVFKVSAEGRLVRFVQRDVDMGLTVGDDAAATKDLEVAFHRFEFVLVATAGALAALTAVISFAFRLRNDVALRRPALRWMGICVLAVAFAAPRVAVDVAINGLPNAKAAAILVVEEAQAGAGFKPSEITRGNGVAYQMLDVKGVGLRQMLFEAPYSWLPKSLMSAFGVYGYFTVFAPFPVYAALALVASLLILVSGFALTLARPNNASRLLVVAGGASCLIALSSVLNSWFIALQPQGRYLFPILVMLALILGHARPKLPQGLIRALLFASVLLSVYSFVCVALPAFAHAN